jgi:4-alpha-glucanotransferase
MTDAELIKRAAAAGIATSYENWQHQRVEVAQDTLQAILAALASVPSPADARSPSADSAASTDAVGSAGATVTGASAAPAAPAAPAGSAGSAGPAEPAGFAASVSPAAPADPADPADPAALAGSEPDIPASQLPDHRSWGFTIQLYSTRSRQSWGHGDLHDLAELAAWSARELGAGFILVNPLHAAEPVPPISPSPYLPMTRRYSSPLYLRIEDIPEYRQLDQAQRDEIQQLAEPLRAHNSRADLIDRDAVWAAKRSALELVYRAPLNPRRQAAFDAYRHRQGTELAYWASWCALAQEHGPDWRDWPASVASREGGLAAAAQDETLRLAATFHAWLQWLVDDQLAAAQRAALAAGMAHGIIHDLAVGVHPGGADAWAHQDFLVRGISVGAPPDSFNQLGQNWTQPPWHPQRLAAAGYRPLAELFAGTYQHAGGLRVDHVMGLMRLWWVPEGMTADRGAYVRYDHQAAVAALTGAASRAGGIAIGEDLGTVDPLIRSYLASHGVLGTTMLWFAQEPDGSPLRPDRWRRGCMATVGTHDVPTIAGFRSGDQVTVRARLGLLTTSEEAERKRSADMLAAWRDTLEREGLLPRGARPGLADLTVALYGFLARTPAVLIGVALTDAVGDSRSQNIPGTSDEYPNWRIPLCDESGQPVLIDDLPGLPLVGAVARAVSVNVVPAGPQSAGAPSAGVTSAGAPSAD